MDAVESLVNSTESLDLSGEVVDRSVKMLCFYAEQLAKYPQCHRAIQISMPDLQGPFDTAEQLWGSDIFIGLIDQPKLVTALMEKVSEKKILLCSNRFGINLTSRWLLSDAFGWYASQETVLFAIGRRSSHSVFLLW